MKQENWEYEIKFHDGRGAVDSYIVRARTIPSALVAAVGAHLPEGGDLRLSRIEIVPITATRNIIVAED